MDYLNIMGIDKEKVIKEVIDTVREELDEITTERTCRVYNEYINYYLTKNRIMHRTVDTEDYGCNYSHVFSIVPNIDDYYLIDLTYEQFHNNKYLDLLVNGYQKVNKKELNDYIKLVGNKDIDISTDDLLFKNKKSK